MRRTELTALILLVIVLVGAIVLGTYNVILNVHDSLTFLLVVWYALTL